MTVPLPLLAIGAYTAVLGLPVLIAAVLAGAYWALGRLLEQLAMARCRAIERAYWRPPSTSTTGNDHA